MSFGKKILLTVAVAALPVATTSLVFAGPAGAASSTFTGVATGTVTCAAPKLTIKFSPPMKLSSGGSTIAAKGVLKGCTTSGGTNLKITLGKISGSFTGTGSGCAGLITGLTTPATFTITWKGTTADGGKASIAPTTAVLQGANPSTNGAGDVGFTLPATVAGSSVSGSFAGPVTAPSTVFSTMTTSQVTAKCDKALSSLKVTSGAITLP